ncbi:MAG TPA: hypothetical protein VJ578_00750 [Dehalococcoidia bacterium]|nr:hypothetical protein [Dehalococcoidia bacterium]
MEKTPEALIRQASVALLAASLRIQDGEMDLAAGHLLLAIWYSRGAYRVLHVVPTNETESAITGLCNRMDHTVNDATARALQQALITPS